MFYPLQLAGVSKTPCIWCRNCFLVSTTWGLLLTFLKWVGRKRASSSNFCMPSDGYAYSVNNEIFLGEKDIVHQESSPRNVLSDGPSDECVGITVCGQKLWQWLKSRKIQHGIEVSGITWVLERSIAGRLQNSWLILCNSGRFLLLNSVYLLLVRQDLFCGLVSKTYSISRNLKPRDGLNRHSLRFLPTATIC